MTQKITLNHLTKIEGHAKVDIQIQDGKVKKCHVHSTEGARYFEDIIQGKSHEDITLITSRICGICSCGHTVASITAIEKAFDVKPTTQDRLLRELITIGERIRSHASHLYFFALPDYLGYESAIEMAKDQPEKIKNCLQIISTGNELVKLIGGRNMHPFVLKTGGSTKIQPKEQYTKTQKKLEKIIPLLEDTIKLFAELKIPNYEKPDTIFCSLKNHKTFPLLSGEITSNKNHNFPPKDYQKFITEHFHKDSTSKFASIEGKQFMTGALARINNCKTQLTQRTKKLINKYKIKLPSTNLFHNNLAQAIEMLHWTERAIDIIKNNKFKPEKKQPMPITGKKQYKGISCVEVPRGILFHDYTFNEKGIVTKANIITPTTQNLASMELHLQDYINQILEKEPQKKESELTLEIEKLIRAFDPCFSCSTHFLKVNFKYTKS